MGKFTKSFNISVEFDGDKIDINMNRLTNEQFKILSPFMNEDGVMTIKDQTEFMMQAAKVVPDSINSISGMSLGDGELVTKDNNFGGGVVFSNTYFLGFVGDVTKALMQNSFLNGDELKKSQEKLEKDSQEQEAMPES